MLQLVRLLIVFVRVRFDIESLKATDAFSKLEQGTREIITALFSTQANLQEIIRQEGRQTRTLVTDTASLALQARDKAQFLRDVKNSLHYPQMFSREKHIAYEFDGIEDSYDWIFKESSTDNADRVHETS